MTTEQPPQIDLSPQQDGKVLKRILVEGTDEKPFHNADVEVHYTGRLLSGEKFDSSVDRNETFKFKLGAGQVIRGWDLTVASMRRGEKCEVTIHADFAYGSKGSPPKIPPEATLVFEIELLSWEMQDLSDNPGDRLVERLILSPGEGYDHPTNGAQVTVNLKGYLASDTAKVIDDRKELKFLLGEGCESGIIRGVELAVEKMQKGERCRVFVRSAEYTKLTSECQEVKLPDLFEPLVYEIELLGFDNCKEIWDMSTDERLEQCERTKTRGTEYFRQNKLELALTLYKKIIKLVGPPENQNFGDKEEARSQYLLSGYLNLAICYLKLEQPEKVIENANLALQLDANNQKALFRRGCAMIMVKEYEKAISDFEQCLETEPDNKAVKQQILICKQKLKAHADLEKKLYRNLFDVLGKEEQ